jgi:hypothetical protein
MRLKEFFLSPVKGTFLSASLATALGAFLATALYINDNYSNPLTIFSKYYLSIRGFAFGVMIPVFVGVMTAGLVLVSKRINYILADRKALKYIALPILAIAYIFITFIGALIILYFGN